MHTAAEKMADNFRSAIARVYRTGDSKGIKRRGFSRSFLWQLVCTAVKHGPLLLWHMIPQKSPLSFINAFWKDSWVSKKVLILRAPQNRSDAHFFLLVQMQEQSSLFKQSSPWESCASWPSSCKQKWYIDSGSARAPELHPSKVFWMPYNLASLSILKCSSNLHGHIIGGWRELDNLTPHEAHHSSRVMKTYHTRFGVPLEIVPGWWDDRKINHEPVFLLYLCLDISNNLSRALSCLRLSGHNFLVQRMCHNRNWRPYELGIFDKCDWHAHFPHEKSAWKKKEKSSAYT